MSDPSIKYNCDSVCPVFGVDDVKIAADYYRDKLGFTLNWLWGNPPDYAGMSMGNVSIHLAGNNDRVGKGSAFFSVDDADALYQFHKQNGVKIVGEIGDREYNSRDYYIHDLHGNFLAFGQYLMPKDPELKIERVDVTLRLEKRLAALLADLAEIKRMTVGQTLEETLLHTLEPFGDGVASPHTKSDLRKIQELKKKHGIDYDTHASYRFVE